MSKDKCKEKGREKLNRFCLIGFICSFFFFLLSFILSLIGIHQVNKNGQRGKGLAEVGIVIVFLKIIILFDPFHLFYYPSITPDLNCNIVDENGNYEQEDTSDVEGKLVCKNYFCEVHYAGKVYRRKCK